MPAASEVAAAHARARQRIGLAVAAEAQRLWQQVDPARISESWLAQLARLLVLVTGAQRAVAGRADEYLAEVLAAQGLASAAEGEAVAEAFSRVASDGRRLDGLLYRPAVTALRGIGRGAGVDGSMQAGGYVLDMIVRTQIADAGRAADLVATIAQPRATGYARMLVGKSCSRCVVLAGRWYRYNAGFPRHPKCDCIHIPGRESTAGDLATDPKVFFRSLSAAEQDRVFTVAGAEAIRLGADIGQVVNARRGAAGLTPAGARITAEEARALRGGREVSRLRARRISGQDLFVTTEGSSAKASRLMPESILRIAGDDRAEALRLLKRFGYLR